MSCAINIISSMIYPALLVLVGLGSILVLLNFVVPRFAAVFSESRMKIPVPTMLMLEASKIVQAYWWMAAAASLATIAILRGLYSNGAGRLWWDTLRFEDSVAWRCAAQGGNGAIRAVHGYPGGQHGAAGAIDGIAAAVLNNKRSPTRSVRLLKASNAVKELQGRFAGLRCFLP